MHNSLCDFILDGLQNSIEAGASVVTLDLIQTESDLTVKIGDNGKGMNEVELEQAKDPFYTDGKKHVHRKVGLGIPFIIQTVNMTEGEFDISSKEGEGTSVYIRFNLSHIDTPPLGDVAMMLYQIMSYSGDFELTINRRFLKQKDEKDYQLSRNELQDILGELTDASSLNLLKQYVQSQEDDLI